VTCERGAEGALRKELVRLRIRKPTGARGGVSFFGTAAQGAAVCMYSRTAMRVLLQLTEATVEDADALYDCVRTLAWPEHLSPATSFAVRAQAHGSEKLNHGGFVALKTKDAIVDLMRERFQSRPSVDSRDPDVTVAVHVNGTRVRVFLDLAGTPLHRRGYRVEMTDAPLKETLGAAVLALAHVDPEKPFVDPMGGSGTLAIEHALAARDIAPGLKRRFGCERWPTQSWRDEMQKLRQEAKERIRPRALAPIHLADIDPSAVAAAQSNARAAGVIDDITFASKPLSAQQPPGSEAGNLCTNPPYGQRVQRPSGPGGTPFARELARVASLFWGWRICVIAPNQGLQQALGKRPDFTHRLENGGVPVRLERYSLTA